MRFEYTVSIEVERVEGKFASRDEIAEIIQEALQSAADDLSVSGIGSDGTSEYEVTDAVVDETDPKELAKRDRAAERARAAKVGA